ncbi:hypothetical protein TCAL_16707 [Tigriopus californicus]|uniref:Uncharacterized protein n=1 Tax=Tigriopus californicus TaxID=6832 RepID=A0A553PK18_TIGCA|nr:hypothetical protein TCAL_16707 [Tigriopus californicus]
MQNRPLGDTCGGRFKMCHLAKALAIYQIKRDADPSVCTRACQSSRFRSQTKYITMFNHGSSKTYCACLPACQMHDINNRRLNPYAGVFENKKSNDVSNVC